MCYFFLGKHLGEELLGLRVDVCLTLWETARPISKALIPFPPPAAVYESSSYSISSPALGVMRLWFMDSNGYIQWNIAVGAICISLMTTTIKHLSISLLIICKPPFMRCLVKHFHPGLFNLFLNCKSFFMYSSHLSDICIVSIFLPTYFLNGIFWWSI